MAPHPTLEELSSAAGGDIINEDTTGAVIIADVERVPRTIGFFETISVAFNLLSSWLTIASTLILGLGHGGPVAVIYGLIVIMIMYSAVALSLAEMAARYTTSGGQYHWTSLLAPDSMKRGLSYSCGSINTIGRVAMTASIDIIVAQLIVAIVVFNTPNFNIEPWHVFLQYQAINAFTLFYNIFALGRAPWTHGIGFVISIASFLAISVTCLAVTEPKQSSSFVWQSFINDTAWESDGLVFLLGLINPTYGFGGLDGAIHLAEDCLEPARTVPRALCTSLYVGFVTALFFVVSMLYCVKDIEAAINSRTGVPIYEVWAQATQSKTAATVFMTSTMVAAFIASIGSVQTSSRLTWSFARDDAMVFSTYIKRTNDKLGVPVWALLFNGLWLFVLGCIYLVSSSAFNVFIGTAMLTELISFAFPAALLMWRRRDLKYLPRKGPFKLGKFGWLVNSLVVGWAAFALVIFSLPVTRHVTPGSMSTLVPSLASTPQKATLQHKLAFVGIVTLHASFLRVFDDFINDSPPKKLCSALMPARLSSMELSDPAIVDTGSGATDMPNRRKSGRITYKPVLLQADPNASMSTNKSGKRKRSSYTQTAEIADDQSDESSVTDSDGDPDEEELKDRRRKTRSRKPSSKLAAKKAKIGNAQTTTLPVRPAMNGVKKAPRPRKPKAHPTAPVADSGTGLFSEIFSGVYTIDGVVAEWITRYEQNNTDAMCDLINLVIRCTGCELQVNVHDIEDPDHATSKLEELQDAYHAQRITDYPLISRGKGFASFRATMVGFFDSLIQTCHSAGIFYTDETLIDNLEYWVTAMTSSPIRPFRHTATVICLAIESALCVVATEVANTAANTLRQKEGEEKKKSVNKERVNALKARINEQERRQEVVRRYLEDMFNAVYLNRYRDVDPKIRVDCVAALGNWIATHPEHFFSGSYLRHMGWVMSDPSVPTRAEVIRQLTRLYKNKDVGRLRAFTERFRPRMVEMAVRDAEPGIRASTVELLDLIRETGLLEPDDIDTIGRLIFDNDPKVRNAVSGFFAENINDLLETVIEEVGGEEGLAEAIGEDPEDDFDLPRRSWLKYKCLAEVLQSYNSEDDEDLDGATREVNGNLVAIGAESRFSLASQVVYRGVTEVREWEALAGYLLYDFSSAPQTQVAKRKGQSMDSAERIFRERCQLNEKEETMLLEVLNVAVKQRLIEAIEAGTDKKGKRSKARVEESKATQESITLHLAQVLPSLLKKFGANPANASAVLRLEQMLNLEIFQELRQGTTTYASLLNDINRQFLTHVDQNVLTEASNALLHARSFEDLEEVTEVKVRDLWADTINSLRSLVSVKENGRTINLSSLCNTLRRISNLASISDCVAALDAEARSTSKNKTPAMTARPLHIITALISGDMFSEDEQDSGNLDEAVINAIKAVLFYYMWLARSLKLTFANKTARAPTALPDYSAFAESLISVMNARSGPDARTDPLRLAAASAYLDLHTLFASLRPASSDPKSRPNDATAATAGAGRDDDNVISSPSTTIPASIQDLLLSIFVAAEKHYARLSHRVLDRPDPNDPVDDAPMEFLSSDSDDDEDNGAENDAGASDERRRTAVLKAEKALCEIAGKMVLGVLAGVFADGGGKVKARVRRNKGRLGANFKEVVGYLEEKAGQKDRGKGKGKQKEKGKGKVAKEAKKNKEVVVEESSDSETEGEAEEPELQLELPDDRIENGSQEDEEGRGKGTEDEIMGD